MSSVYVASPCLVFSLVFVYIHMCEYMCGGQRSTLAFGFLTVQHFEKLFMCLCICSGEGVGFPETRITGRCELHVMGVEIEPGSYERVLLTAQPSLLPISLFSESRSL